MSVIRRAFTEDFTIYRVAELKPVLLAVIQEGEHIELDLSGVEHMDSAGCQLLIFAKREAGRRQDAGDRRPQPGRAIPDRVLQPGSLVRRSPRRARGIAPANPSWTN
jgi:hypothetical protein